jgi:archaeosortase B (VPXXXP-CTERM-specific)
MDNVQAHEIKIKIKFDEKSFKFLLLLSVSLLLFYVASVFFESFIPVFNMLATAQTLFLILKFLGLSSSLNGTSIIFSNFGLEIIRQCTGVFEVIALASCIIAYPTALKTKLYGLAAGIPFIYTFNMGRLILLAFVGVYSPSVFTAIHEYLLQLTFAFFVIFFFLFWIGKATRNDKK